MTGLVCVEKGIKILIFIDAIIYFFNSLRNINDKYTLNYRYNALCAGAGCIIGQSW